MPVPAAVAPLGLVLLGLASAFNVGALYSMSKGVPGSSAAPGVSMKIRLMISNAIDSELRQFSYLPAEPAKPWFGRKPVTVPALSAAPAPAPAPSAAREIPAPAAAPAPPQKPLTTVKQLISTAIATELAEMTAAAAKATAASKAAAAASKAAAAKAKADILTAIANELKLFTTPIAPGVKNVASPNKITEEDAVANFTKVIENAKGKGTTKDLLKIVADCPSIVSKNLEGASTLQAIVAAAIADATGQDLPVGLVTRLKAAAAAAAKPIASATGAAGKLVAAALKKTGEAVAAVNPIAIASRRAEAAKLAQAAYTGGASQKDWALVVRAVLYTPYVYTADTLAAAEAELEAQRAASATAAARGHYKGRSEDEIATAVAKAETAVKDALTAEEDKRKETPKPKDAFNDLIAMKDVPAPERAKTAALLVPILKEFMWWRWKVTNTPLMYPPDMVVHATHMFDGMTETTQPEAPFWNASVTLRRYINEKRGQKPTPAEKEALAKENAELAKWEQLGADSVKQAKALNAAAEKAAYSNRPGAQEEYHTATAAAAAAAAAAKAAKAADANFKAKMAAANQLEKEYAAQDAADAADEAATIQQIERGKNGRAGLTAPTGKLPPNLNVVRLQRAAEAAAKRKPVLTPPEQTAVAADAEAAAPSTPQSPMTAAANALSGVNPAKTAEDRAAAAARWQAGVAKGFNIAPTTMGGRRHRTPKRRRGRKSRNSTFRRHRKH